MIENWKIIIEAYPHSTGNGRESDEKAVGGRIHKFCLETEDFFHATELAKAIVEGMETNPMVWQANIIGVIHDGISVG